MTFSLSTIREDIHEFLDETVFPGQPVHQQAVEDESRAAFDARDR